MTRTLQLAVLGLVATLAFLLIGWRIVAVNLADELSEGDAAASLSWDSRQPESLLTVAMTALATDPARAGMLARRAIESSPADGRGFGVLARALEAQGHLDQADRMYAVALRLAPRDAPTRAAYAQSLLRRAQWRAAIEELRILSWLRPQLTDKLYDDLLRLVESPESRSAVIDPVLAGPVSAREAFVRYAFSREPSAKIVDELFAALIAVAPPATQNERQAYLERITRDGRWLAAWMIWSSGLNPGERAQLGNVFNGSFELPISGAPFDWRADAVKGARVDVIEDRSVDGNRVAQISFFDQRVAFAHLRQYLVLGPGTYRFSGSVSPDHLESARGLIWRLSCAPPAPKPLGESERFSGTAPWRRFEIVFSVPAAGCDGQLLRLESAARTAIEQQISGRLWFDDLRIRRLPEPLP